MKRVPCPSCRAEITVADDGEPENPEVAHFHVGNDAGITDPGGSQPAVPANGATPDTQQAVAPSSAPSSFWQRLNSRIATVGGP